MRPSGEVTGLGCPLIPQFEQLTGMKVKYLILPEEEYFQKIEVDKMQTECP